MRKKIYYLILMNFICAFFITMLSGTIGEKSKQITIPEDYVTTAEYRAHNLSEEMIPILQKNTNPGKHVGVYLLDMQFGNQDWERQDVWNAYLKTTSSIWNDVKYFPVPESTSDSDLTVSYVNTWMSERTYGGQRGHEGVDIMANKNIRGLYPIISMTDGVVTKKGWLEKGGYRIGIEAPGGAYFYYAHLESYANINIGDEVKAGDILGFMGDSGYGKEGTVGQFPVHLHLGIYIYSNEKEVSINPYWVLRYIENRKVKCYTEI